VRGTRTGAGGAAGRTRAAGNCFVGPLAGCQHRVRRARAAATRPRGDARGRPPPRSSRYPPYRRPSAATALAHPYFSRAPAPASPAEVGAFAAVALERHGRVAAALSAMG
jgi:hypothetical protein